jgi:hypothetical protein
VGIALNDFNQRSLDQVLCGIATSQPRDEEADELFSSIHDGLHGFMDMAVSHL